MRLADGAGACGGVILLLTYCKICAKMEDMNKEPLMDPDVLQATLASQSETSEEDTSAHGGGVDLKAESVKLKRGLKTLRSFF